jgi:uncharacterized protein (TIGR04255 family)
MMSSTLPKLKNPPIVEAVVDIDCDLPPNVPFESLEERGRDCFADKYPVRETRFSLEHEVEFEGDTAPKTRSKKEVEKYLFLQEDRRQLVQIRRQGFSFNRLAPYTTLDEYLPEIERTWERFVRCVNPVRVREIRLRYINRIRLPLADGKVDLDLYLSAGPRLPNEENLSFAGFLSQYVAVEKETKNQVRTILTSSQRTEDFGELIFDITAFSRLPSDTLEWSHISSHILSLRNLKNSIFRDTLTPQCLELFH